MIFVTNIIFLPKVNYNVRANPCLFFIGFKFITYLIFYEKNTCKTN